MSSLSACDAGVQALNDVELTIPTGMFGLLGPNGAGKSTLMRTIATLQAADSGRVFLDDLDVLKNKAEVRKILGYLPQDFGVYPKVAAEDLLDHLAKLKGIVPSRDRREVVHIWRNSVSTFQTFGRLRQTHLARRLIIYRMARQLIRDALQAIIFENQKWRRRP